MTATELSEQFFIKYPMFTYLTLHDFPAVPDALTEQALHIAENNFNTDSSYIDVGEGYRHREIKYQGKSLESRCQIACDMAQEWYDWVHENITEDYLESGVRVNNDNGSTMHGPHTDPPTEKYKLYYLIKKGGSNVVTEWYKETGKPLTRAPGTTVNDYALVETIDQVTLPERTWLLFNTNILHGVRNLESQRVNLVVTLKPAHDIVKKYLLSQV
jgi:hypothetical protein